MDGDGFPNDHPSRPATSQEAAVAWRIRTRLHDETSLRDETITVQVQSRVVILHGSVPSARARDLAGRLARGVGGVDDVCNGLRVTCHGPRTEDAEPALDPFDDIVRHLTADDGGGPRRGTLRPTAAAVAPGLLLAALCALLLIPHDQGQIFAAVAAVLTAAGVLGSLRRRPDSPR